MDVGVAEVAGVAGADGGEATVAGSVRGGGEAPSGGGAAAFPAESAAFPAAGATCTPTGRGARESGAGGIGTPGAPGAAAAFAIAASERLASAAGFPVGGVGAPDAEADGSLGARVAPERPNIAHDPIAASTATAAAIIGTPLRPALGAGGRAVAAPVGTGRVAATTTDAPRA